MVRRINQGVMPPKTRRGSGFEIGSGSGFEIGSAKNTATKELMLCSDLKTMKLATSLKKSKLSKPQAYKKPT